ncbi:MAG: imidazolonepropionase [Thermotogae bacterium]|uniref:imidazolonepropionase n=1 Tax=Kosmotoga sp. TaxID=1955248 RepID=UPI000F1B99D2|nr:imidazolonepropionase [Kosmotoga sp.]MBO8165912.1 imidazolonepropionase [Kosmotoga sp.]RKX50360.1 MAG: imidazolonepropionase [Thermotogota bacterium]
MKLDTLIVGLKEVVSPIRKGPVRGNEMGQLKVRKGTNIGIKNGKIAYIGTERPPALREVQAHGLVALPGFVDCHTHIPFIGNRSFEFLMRLEGRSYMEIMENGGGIFSTVKAVREASEAELFRYNMKSLVEMAHYGITTVEGKSGYGLDKESELKQLSVLKRLNASQPIDVASTFLGAHAFPDGYHKKSEYLEYLLGFVDKVKKYTNTADIFCEKGVFEPEESRRFLKELKRRGFRIRLHADELAASGGGKLAVELGAVSADHLIAADDETLRAIASSDVTAVLMPGTSFFLREKYARGDFLISHNGIVALGSDFNPGSCNIYDPLLVIHLAVSRNGLKVEEAITAYTANSAHVLDVADRKGLLEIGYDADLVLLDLESYLDLPYMFSREAFAATIKEGKVIAGDL